MVGYLWSHLPVGDVGYRMNLFSALCGALTVALSERILRRLEVGAWAAFAALGTLTTATYFWSLSLIAEVYTLHTVFLAAVILSLLRWHSDPLPKRLALFGLLLGLSFGHHASTVLLLPGFLWYILATEPRSALNPRALVLALAGVILGASVYLYLPLRYAARPAFNYVGYFDSSGTFLPVNLQTLSGMWWLISGKTFQGLTFAYRGVDWWFQTTDFLRQISRAFLVIGLGPGILGCVVLVRRRRALGGMLLAVFFGHALFYIGYRVADKDLMFLPNYVIWAIWMAVGCQVLLSWVERTYADSSTGMEVKLVRGVLVAGVVVTLIWNWSLVNKANDWSARQHGEAILQELERDAYLFGYWDTVPVVQYLQLVEGARSDVRAINRFLISYDEMRRLIWQEICHNPVYIDVLPVALSTTFETHQVGPVYRLLPIRGCQKDRR
jgi:hypothetical protein